MPRRLLTFVCYAAFVALATTFPAGADAGVVRTVARAANDIGCPSPPGSPRGIKVWIRVRRWCALPAVRRQAQYKLQVKIHNSSSRTLDISRPHIRLIVKHFKRRQWTPPRIGAPTRERPFRTRYNGRRVWAIPPNAERAYDVKSRNEWTFATHWNAYSLRPGRTFRPRRHKRGAAVFYLPYGGNRARTLRGVMGLAYVDGRDIIVMCPKRRWGPKVPAGSF
jgi:hypothetical protein